VLFIFTSLSLDQIMLQQRQWLRQLRLDQLLLFLHQFLPSFPLLPFLLWHLVHQFSFKLSPIFHPLAI
jgi:hypothetical protein